MLTDDQVKRLGLDVDLAALHEKIVAVLELLPDGTSLRLEAEDEREFTLLGQPPSWKRNVAIGFALDRGTEFSGLVSPDRVVLIEARPPVIS